MRAAKNIFRFILFSFIPLPQMLTVCSPLHIYVYIRLHIIYKFLVWDPIFRGKPLYACFPKKNFTWLTILFGYTAQHHHPYHHQEDKRSRSVFSSPWKDLDYKTLNDFVRRIFFETIQLVLWLSVQKNKIYFPIWHLFAPCINIYKFCILKKIKFLYKITNQTSFV